MAKVPHGSTISLSHGLVFFSLMTVILLGAKRGEGLKGSGRPFHLFARHLVGWGSVCLLTGCLWVCFGRANHVGGGFLGPL